MIPQIDASYAPLSSFASVRQNQSRFSNQGLPSSSKFRSNCCFSSVVYFRRWSNLSDFKGVSIALNVELVSEVVSSGRRGRDRTTRAVRREHCLSVLWALVTISAHRMTFKQFNEYLGLLGHFCPRLCCFLSLSYTTLVAEKWTGKFTLSSEEAGF